MRAARLHAPGEPLRVEEMPTPKPGPGEALIRVQACGMCGSDLHFWDGSVPTGKLPVTLGHEPAGTIEALGPGVEGRSIGERVIPLGGRGCGRCRLCLEGRPSACANFRIWGTHEDGGFADYIKMPADMLAPIPDNLPTEQAAILSDAVAVPYHALIDRGRLKAGETVAIFGVGGLGLHAVQIARVAGAARVIAVDVRPSALERAGRMGADDLVDGRKEPPHRVIRLMTAGGVDASFEFVGIPETADQAVKALRRGGRAVLVGMGDRPLSLAPPRVFVWSELELLGAFGSTRLDLEAVIAMAARGQIDLSESVSVRVPLSDVNEGLRILRDKIGDPVRVLVIP